MTAKTFAPGEVLSAADVNEYLTSGYWRRINRQIVASGSPVSTVTFSLIPSTYRAFRLLVDVRTSANSLRLRINNDTGANYDIQRHHAVGSSTTADLLSNNDHVQLSIVGGAHGVGGEYIISKSNASNVALIHGRTVMNSGDPLMYNLAGQWENTSALINRIDVYVATGNFYGVVALEGMGGF